MTQKSIKPILIIVGLLLFTFFFPRLLISQLGMDNPWTSYLYLYVFGGLFFCSGLLLIYKTKSYKPKRAHDDKWFFSLILGMIFFASLHAVWILASLNIPFKGVQ